MKDSRSGPAAIVTVVLVLIVKFAALSALTHTAYWPALVLAPLLRTRGVGVAVSSPRRMCAREGIGAAHAVNPAAAR